MSIPYFYKEVKCPIYYTTQKVAIYYAVSSDGKYITIPNGCDNLSGGARCQECLNRFREVLDELPD